MRVVRKSGSALAACLALSACVQTRQYADLQFTPPQGDYKLLVLRPDVAVGSLTTDGMVEPRAEWTEQARTNLRRYMTFAGARRQMRLFTDIDDARAWLLSDASRD